MMKRTAMAAGATLCLTSLASAGWSPSPFMRVTASYLNLVENGTYGTTTFNWSNLNGGAGYNFLDPTGVSNPTTTGWANVAAGGNALVSIADIYGYTDLMFQAQAGTGTNTAGGTATGWIDVVFDADTFVYGANPFWNGGLAAWTVAGNVVGVGDFFANGSVVRFDYVYSWPSGSNGLSSGISFWGGGGGGGVPLPGAAGLAACGLLGMSRRRRR